MIGHPLPKRGGAFLLHLVGQRRHALRLREQARFDDALRVVATEYLHGFPAAESGFTRDAAKRLRKLEEDALVLALASYAYDAHHAIAAALRLHDDGREEEARREWEALLGRNLGGWAMQRVGLSRRPDVYELAAPLDLGLGPELKAMLHTLPPDYETARAWLTRHAEQLDRFGDYLAERAKLIHKGNRSSGGN